jgi:hypothetical protein
VGGSSKIEILIMIKNINIGRCHIVPNNIQKPKIPSPNPPNKIIVGLSKITPKNTQKNIDLEKQTKHFGEKLIKSHKYVKHLRTKSVDFQRGIGNKGPLKDPLHKNWVICIRNFQVKRSFCTKKLIRIFFVFLF